MFLRLLAGLLLLASSAQADEGLDRRMGKELFERNWVQAPSTTRASDGLGPLFNARSCAACHPGGGAVGFEPSAEGSHSVGLVARFAYESDSSDPFYGRQLQTAAITTQSPEGRVWLDPDGRPALNLSGPPLAARSGIGFRRAPTLAGRGLIATIPDAAILGAADPEDADGDGISGRARMIGERVGRFGWKADHATLEDQVASAFSMDMGLSSRRDPDHFGDCTMQQPDCRLAHDGSDALGEGFELSEAVVDLVSLYVATLGKERPGAASGLALFEEAGCAACHMPVVEGTDGPVGIYSDLLLHDMGAANADGFSMPGVLASEWRTAPLIGLSTSNSRMMHDGRAATAREAIGLHGGEASAARDAFAALAPAQQEELLRFVEGL